MKPAIQSLLILMLFTSTVNAGGLYLREFGQPAQGTAGSGGNVLAQDASTAFQNPAGIFNLKEDSEWMVTGIVIDSSVKFQADANNTITGTNGGDAGGTIVGGALFHTRKLNDDWGLSFALNSVSGAALEYDNTFYDRYAGYDVDLLTVNFTPSIAYKVNEELSVAFSVPIMYGKLDLEAAIPPLIGPGVDGIAAIENGDDFNATIGLSLLWQATEDWRFALNYFGENELTFDSDLSIKLLPGDGTGINNIGADIEVVLPQAIAASAMHEVNEKLTLTARLGWEDWSTLDSIPISTNLAGAAIPLDWDDVWNISVGMRWKTGDRWTYYTGIAYDSDPTDAQNRIGVLPVDEQWRLAGGFTYDLSDKREFGVSLTYVDLGDAPINRTTDQGIVSGDYSSNEMFILGVNYGWR